MATNLHHNNNKNYKNKNLYNHKKIWAPTQKNYKMEHPTIPHVTQT